MHLYNLSLLWIVSLNCCRLCWKYNDLINRTVKICRSRFKIKKHLFRWNNTFRHNSKYFQVSMLFYNFVFSLAISDHLDNQKQNRWIAPELQVIFIFWYFPYTFYRGVSRVSFKMHLFVAISMRFLCLLRFCYVSYFYERSFYLLIYFLFPYSNFAPLLLLRWF